MKKKRIKWEKAILKVVENCGGVATLKELYSQVPEIRTTKTTSKDPNHVIRAYLRRLVKTKKQLKKIGLSTYCLAEREHESTIYEKISEGINEEEILNHISKDEIHSYIEGMLIELGNYYGYSTYTADLSATFNEKPFSAIASIEQIPKFSFPKILEIVKYIDVIWFEDNFPKHTFDVENSTDFSKALYRAYQLRHYKTIFYMISLQKKKTIFDKRINSQPYIQIQDDVVFRSYESVYKLYQLATKHYRRRRKFIEL